jgi:hypothetical protein
MKRLQYSKYFFVLFVISIITFSCNKEEIELPENTVTFLRNGEQINITENNTTGFIAFPNTLQVRGTLIDNNVYIEARFKGERLLLSITDTTEQVYAMDSQATSFKYFNTTDCNAYSSKPGTGTVEIIDWDTKNKTCKGRFRVETASTSFDGTEEGPEFISGEFNVIIFKNINQILDNSLELIIENKAVDFFYYSNNNINNVSIVESGGSNSDSIINFNILFPKQTSEGIQEDNSKIMFNLNYNFNKFRNIHPDNGQIIVSINNISLQYFAVEVENLVLIDLANPANTMTINYGCIKIPY